MNSIKKTGVFTLFFSVVFFISFSIIKNTYSLDEVPVHEDFDDINFYKCVVEKYNKATRSNLDYRKHILNDTQLNYIRDLTCDGESLEDSEKVKSIKGIEKIPNLEYLTLNNTLITEMDLSNNAKLINISSTNNKLTNINLKNLINLKSIHLDDTPLSTIDLSDNINLYILWIFQSNISNIDVSKNVKLESLGLWNNKISDIDLSNNILLSDLNLADNQFVEVDLSHNINLENLDIYSNKLKKIDLSNNHLLKWLTIYENELTELDLSNNPELWNVEAYCNNLSNIVLGEGVIYLDLYDNNLREIDLSNSLELDYLDAEENELTSIDINKNINLYYLYLGYNNISKLDISNNINLKYLGISENEVNELDVSKNIGLKYLDITDNKIKSLDLTNNINLTELFAKSNSFGDIIYAYKGEKVKLPEFIKLPEQLNEWIPNYTSDDENIAKVNTTGEVLAKNIGTTSLKGKIDLVNADLTLYADINIKVNVVELTSDKYTIDEGNNYIYVGTEHEFENIKKNLKLSNDNVKLEINEENMTLYVKYKENILKEFKIINIKTKSINIINNKIDLTKSMSVEEFINDFIIDDDKIFIKVYQNNELVPENKIITSGMNIKIFYDNKELDEFILTEIFKFDDNLKVDEENKLLLDTKEGITANDILNKITTEGKINIKDNKGNNLQSTDLVGTGSKVTIDVNDVSYEYSIVVPGDVDGDGMLKLQDVMKIANYNYINKNSLDGIYLKAADYDLNNKLDLTDIMKIANKIYRKGM